MSEYGYSGEFIGYGVELSRKTAHTKPRPRGRRGLDRNAILDAAFAMLSQEGEAGFSVRKLGLSIGVDPMTVLHHFGSIDGLHAALMERMVSQLIADVLAIPDQGGARDDQQEAAGPVVPVAGEKPRAVRVAAYEHPEAVVFDFVNPVTAGRRPLDRARQTGLAEVGRLRDATT